MSGGVMSGSSLRVRLAAWNAIVVVLTAFAVLLVLRQGIQWALIHEIDAFLSEDLQEIEIALRETPADEFGLITHELQRKATGHRRHGWFVQLRDDHNQPIWSSDDRHRDVKFPSGDAQRYATLLNDERVVQQAVPENLHDVASVVVGEQLQLLRSDISQIDRLVLITAGCILVAAPLCGYWLAGRAATVIGEIIQTAARLRPDHLNERLPIRGTRDELDLLAATINRLLDRIAAFLEKKRDVLANAAHELRSPLAAIRSSVEVALNGDRSPAEYQELLEDVMGQSESLEKLLNQLLMLSETETESLKTQLEPVALHSLVNRSLAMFQGVAEARDIALINDGIEPAFVLGNRVHLSQVVSNLVDNAIKYSRPGGSIRVSLTADRDTDVARLRVRDNGLGISAEDLPLVFDRFFRADRSRSRTDAPTGTGLGLSICKAVVEAHGGKIVCESNLGAGTSFDVVLPMEPGIESQLEPAGRFSPGEV
jgi:two-component system, OmpR family, heavy metal sensor histidine kinase CusS